MIWIQVQLGAAWSSSIESICRPSPSTACRPTLMALNQREGGQQPRNKRLENYSKRKGKPRTIALWIERQDSKFPSNLFFFRVESRANFLVA